MVPTHGDDPFLGQELAGKYRVVARLGSGGFGTVYSAVNVALGTEVAVKIGRGPEGGARMLREARAAARLRSPHTVRVFDVGELPGGAPFIVMELLPGRSLKERLAKEGPLAVGLAAHFVGQVCAALREAHAEGLVHRDLKPSNLFVVEGPTLEAHVKLLDFGLVKSLEPTGDDATKSGNVLGSPQYMSPEQIRGVNVTALSDLWSLGVVLYECLSGKLPFERDTVSGTLVAIASEPMRPLAEVAPGLPPLLYEVVSRCLRKTPDERFESARALAAALAPFATPPSGALASSVVEGTSAEHPTDEVTWDTRGLAVTSRDAAADGTPKAASHTESGAKRRLLTFVMLAASALLLVYWVGRTSPALPSDSGVPPRTTGARPPALPREAPERALDPSPAPAPSQLPAASVVGPRTPAPLAVTSARGSSSEPKRTPSPSATRPTPALAPSSRLALEPDF